MRDSFLKIIFNRVNDYFLFQQLVNDFEIGPTRTTTYFTLHIAKKDAYWVLANTSGRQYWLVNIALVIEVSKKSNLPYPGLGSPASLICPIPTRYPQPNSQLPPKLRIFLLINNSIGPPSLVGQIVFTQILVYSGTLYKLRFYRHLFNYQVKFRKFSTFLGSNLHVRP